MRFGIFRSIKTTIKGSFVINESIGIYKDKHIHLSAG
jgi:hypothetical protein